MGAKSAHIGWAKLVLEGGIGFLDLQQYYWMLDMTRVVDWNVHTQCKSWVNLERVIVGTELGSIPWASKQHVLPKLHAHPLAGVTLQPFYRVCKAHSLSDIDFWITPIKDNPDFPRVYRSPIFYQNGHGHKCKQSSFFTGANF